jgi:hypothetical protein
MSSVAYYHAEADRCRELAEASPDPPMATRWRRLASEYEVLARELGRPPLPLSGAQPQPIQQQQSKAKDDK